MYDGVRLGERGNCLMRFVETVTRCYRKTNHSEPNGYWVEKFKALPDTLDDFKAYFIDDDNEVKNMDSSKDG